MEISSRLSDKLLQIYFWNQIFFSLIQMALSFAIKSTSNYYFVRQASFLEWTFSASILIFCPTNFKVRNPEKDVYGWFPI